MWFDTLYRVLRCDYYILGFDSAHQNMSKVMYMCPETGGVSSTFHFLFFTKQRLSQEQIDQLHLIFA